MVMESRGDAVAGASLPRRSGNGNAPPHAGHVVQIYEDDAVLLEELARIVGAALAGGEAAVVLATAAHRAALDERLEAQRLDVAGIAAEGRYVALDAADVLSRIMRDGQPDTGCFGDVIGAVIDRAAGPSNGKQTRVVAFGELVALLCTEGNHAAAVRLEELWNDLARTRAFSLLCAYPMAAFPQAADGAPFAAICAAHSQVIPAEGFTSHFDETERLRSIARLQQQARALESEIAEREKTQGLLRQREAELADFVEEVPVALHWVAADGTILWANRAELELLGYPREEYVGRHIAGFHVDQDVIADVLARLARHETLQDREARLRRKDGAIRHVRITSNALWENGEFVHTRCVTRDVTDRTIAAEATARLAAIVDSSDDAILGKTLGGTITSWNRAAERLYGYAAAEIVGRPIATLVPPERRGELTDIMARLARGEHIAHFETERVRKDGTRVEVSVSISPIVDQRGHVTGASTNARDIGERRSLERQKQEFLEMAAHDLRSPLTVIQAYAQLLQRRQAFDARAVAAIGAEAGRMGRLVTDMLEVARLEVGRLELRRAPLDVVALARDAAAQAAVLAGDRLVRVEAPQRAIVGEWDGDRLAQVLTNLLDNALKYAPRGDVVVRVSSGPREVRIAVVDRGPGLTAEEAKRVFERFFRAPNAAEEARGAGLGLFISKALIEAHGGRLWAESVVGQGSTFVVALPYDSAADATDNAADARCGTAGAAGVPALREQAPAAAPPV